jgi:hypothetical protein
MRPVRRSARAVAGALLGATALALAGMAAPAVTGPGAVPVAASDLGGWLPGPECGNCV